MLSLTMSPEDIILYKISQDHGTSFQDTNMLKRIRGNFMPRAITRDIVAMLKS